MPQPKNIRIWEERTKKMWNRKPKYINNYIKYEQSKNFQLKDESKTPQYAINRRGKLNIKHKTLAECKQTFGGNKIYFFF